MFDQSVTIYICNYVIRNQRHSMSSIEAGKVVTTLLVHAVTAAQHQFTTMNAPHLGLSA